MPKGRCSIALSPPSNADTTRSALHTLHPSLPTALSYAICSITCLMGFDASIALSTFFCLLLACLNNSLCRLFSPLYNYVPFYLPTPPLLFCLAVSCTAVFLLLAQVFCVDYWIIGHLSMDSAASHHWFITTVSPFYSRTGNGPYLPTPPCASYSYLSHITPIFYITSVSASVLTPDECRN